MSLRVYNIKKGVNDAPVAQLVEHLTLNQGVQGSSPCGCTKERFLPLFFHFYVLYKTTTAISCVLV